MTTTQDLYHRNHEVIVKITRDEAYEQCQHGKHIVSVLAHWSDDAPFVVTTGCVNHTQTFPRTLHADGTPGDYCHNVINKCPKCGGLNALTTEQQAWLDLTSCSECDYSHAYSIGD